MPHRLTTFRSLRLAGATVAVLTALPSLAAARHPTPPIKNGYYANLVVVKSTTVEFHVANHSRIPDLVLDCVPADPSLATTTSDILVHIPALTLHHGRFSYNGAATISEAYAGAPTIGTTTVRISAHHVNGPVLHYVYQGHHLKETTAFKGTASSPACTTPLPRNGKFTLFGPVPNE